MTDRTAGRVPDHYRYACPSTNDGHRYREGHSVTRWELLIYCERCGFTAKVDASAWADILPRVAP